MRDSLGRPRSRRLLRAGFILLLPLLAALMVIRPEADAGASPAKINGSGSTYVALAMQQWVADGQSAGLSINYLPTGSPDGLTSFSNGLTDFAGTEAEFTALGGSADIGRGYQYVPDVAGAIAVMYNVDDRAGRKVDYLHLSRRTVAQIFTGAITNWDDPAITADNKGLVLPDQPITVVYRAGQSGTTALFYDFVANVAPDVFAPWAARNKLPTTVRIIQLDSSPTFAPRTLALTGSDQIAQYVASDSGKWAIAYDEFGYAKTYGAPAAWVQNASGAYVQPYAENISAALESATLRPDLSQELSGVYNSGNPLAYPLSAYSYLVTQCAPVPDRPTCHGPYSNGGVIDTLTPWMRYIACEGQVNMARIGYSPLPPNLSQEIANSIGRLRGSPPETLNAANCANPRFSGSLGADASSPQDPLANVASIGGGSGGENSTNANSGAADTGSAASNGAAAGVTGKSGSATKSAGGGSSSWRDAVPVAYNRPGIPSPSSMPLVVFLLLLALPPLGVAVHRRLARKR
jgi:phosphate transport system substrate-binding protein